MLEFVAEGVSLEKSICNPLITLLPYAARIHLQQHLNWIHPKMWLEADVSRPTPTFGRGNHYF